MKRNLLLKTMLLLCALIVGSGSVRAEEIAAYTFSIIKPSSGAVTDYTKSKDMEIDGITWNVPGNWYATGQLRIGGKSISNVDRVITGKGTISDEISKIVVNHAGVNSDNLVVNSVTLTVASDASFTEDVITKTVTPTIGKNTAGNFELTPNVTCPANSYYKIAFNITNSNSSNYALTLNSIVFYKETASKTATTTVISTASLTNTDLKNGTTAGSLSASVTETEGGATVAGATVTWESSDPTVATITNEGVVTLVKVGTTTITATYAGNDTYAVSSDTYELTVSDTRSATVTAIDDAGITNTDLKNGTAAGSFAASVTAGGNPILGATITWTSSDENVATIAGDGTVTLKKVGTTTITASYAGGGSYAASSDTYELTVVDTEQKNPVTIQMTNSLFGQDVHTSGKSTEELTFIGYQDNVKVTYYVPDDSYYYFNTSNTRPYNTCSLTYGAPAGYVITEIDFTSDGSNWYDATPSVGEMTATKTWEGFDQEVTFSWETSGTRVKTVVVTLAEVVTLTPAKTYTTLTSAYALDFTNVSGLEAFIAKDGVSEGSVKMTQVNKVPANTGLVLKATNPGTAVNVPVFDGTGADDVEGNKMVGSATETTAIEKDGGYILSNGVFQPADAGTLAAGKAYLQIAVTSARSLEMSFDDATTAINGIEEVAPVNVKTRKVVKNGRLVIETANGEFTIDGARMK